MKLSEFGAALEAEPPGGAARADPVLRMAGSGGDPRCDGFAPGGSPG